MGGHPKCTDVQINSIIEQTTLSQGRKRPEGNPILTVAMGN
jgi:hypothetical protein